MPAPYRVSPGSAGAFPPDAVPASQAEKVPILIFRPAMGTCFIVHCLFCEAVIILFQEHLDAFKQLFHGLLLPGPSGPDEIIFRSFLFCPVYIFLVIFIYFFICLFPSDNYMLHPLFLYVKYRYCRVSHTFQVCRMAAGALSGMASGGVLLLTFVFLSRNALYILRGYNVQSLVRRF